MKRVRIDVDQILSEAKNEDELFEQSQTELVYLIRAFRVLNEYGTGFFEVNDDDVTEHSQVKFDLDENTSIHVYVIEE